MPINIHRENDTKHFNKLEFVIEAKKIARPRTPNKSESSILGLKIKERRG